MIRGTNGELDAMIAAGVEKVLAERDREFAARTGAQIAERLAVLRDKYAHDFGERGLSGDDLGKDAAEVVEVVEGAGVDRQCFRVDLDAFEDFEGTLSVEIAGHDDSSTGSPAETPDTSRSVAVTVEVTPRQRPVRCSPAGRPGAVGAGRGGVVIALFMTGCVAAIVGHFAGWWD